MQLTATADEFGRVFQSIHDLCAVHEKRQGDYCKEECPLSFYCDGVLCPSEIDPVKAAYEFWMKARKVTE